MSQIAQQVVQPIACDPDNVRETYANGPINVSIMGPCAILTFTTVRGDLAELMAGRQATKFTATVVSRMAVPTNALVGLRDLLNQLVPKGPMVVGTPMGNGTSH